MEIGEIEQNKSRRLHPIQAKKECSLDLRTTDIHGAFAGSVSDKFLRKSVKGEYYCKLKFLKGKKGYKGNNENFRYSWSPGEHSKKRYIY